MPKAKTPPGCDGVSGFSLCLPGRRQALFQEPICISRVGVLHEFQIFGGCACFKILTSPHHYPIAGANRCTVFQRRSWIIPGGVSSMRSLLLTIDPTAAATSRCLPFLPGTVVQAGSLSR